MSKWRRPRKNANVSKPCSRRRLLHPIRSKCLVILAERVASPAEIARELHLDVSKVGYHVNALADAHLIEEIGSRPSAARSSTFTAPFSFRSWIAIDGAYSNAERRIVAETILSIHAANAPIHWMDGIYLDRSDRHLTRLAFNIDEEGWSEATAAYMELLRADLRIQEAAPRG